MSGIANLLGGAGIALGQVAGRGAQIGVVGETFVGPRLYFTQSTSQGDLGDTKVGTLSGTFLPPIGLGSAVSNPLEARFYLKRVYLIIERARIVWSQDSDISVTITGPKIDVTGWVTGTPELVDHGSDFTLVDYSLLSEDLIDLDTVSSWLPTTAGRGVHVLFPPITVPDPLDAVSNNVYWDNDLTTQPNTDLRGRPVSGQAGKVLDEATVTPWHLGVDVRPFIFGGEGVFNYGAVTEEAFQAKLALAPFQFSIRWQVANNIRLSRSFVEFHWARGTSL